MDERQGGAIFTAEPNLALSGLCFLLVFHMSLTRSSSKQYCVLVWRFARFLPFFLTCTVMYFACLT